MLVSAILRSARLRSFLLFSSISLFLTAASLATIFYLLCPPVQALKAPPLRVVSWKSEEKAGPGMPSWAPMRTISRHLVNAILIAEDDRFYSHFGLDFHEIWTSAAKNFQVGSYARGASTVTQQLIKMVFLGPEKTLERKIREGIGAIYLEMIMDKREILEWYLNVVDFGNGVYGIKKAARFYFGIPPQELSLNQAIQLAMILPAPSRWSKGLKDGRLTSFGRKRFAAILSRMEQKHYISSVQYQTSMKTGDFGNPI